MLERNASVKTTSLNRGEYILIPIFEPQLRNTCNYWLVIRLKIELTSLLALPH